jgi:VWFA-related protein
MFAKAHFGARLGLLVLLSVSLGAAVSAQQTSPPAQAGDAKIHLDVVVAPKSGPPVADLQQQDFTLLDNKMPQAIASFQAVNGRQAPIEIVLVIDAINAPYEKISYERDQIDKFLRSEEGRLAHPVALAIFTDLGTQIVGDFSLDGNALSAALDRQVVALRDLRRSAGFWGATERWQLSLQAMSQLVAKVTPHPGRKIVLCVSPGWPLLSGPGIQIDSKLRNQIFTDIVNFSTQMRRGRVTLYSIDPLGAGESVWHASYYQEFVKGVRKPGDVQVGDLGLPVLALQSGGLVFESTNDITAAIERCLADTAPYYEISFAPAPADGPDEYHQLEVKIARPGLTARTRQGYYAQPSPHN